MNLVFLSLIRTQKIYVILGGSGAANFNNYTYDVTNQNVYSYDNGWVTAQSPMPGGDGDEGSPWASLGNNLNLRYGEDIYFIDCAKINSSIIDWHRGGKYYDYANYCLDIAGNFSNRYDVLWQEGSQDNYYSYNSNFFYDTITELVRTNSNWYISISTYGSGEINRISKLEDIVLLTVIHDNIYLGAYMDNKCMGNPPYNQEETEELVDMWEQKIINNEKPLFVNSIYSYCGNWASYGDFFLLIGVSLILIFLCLGCFYSREYYVKRKQYQTLQENDSEI